jgi:hypothetical protein
MLGRGSYRGTTSIVGSGDEALRVVRDALIANGFSVASTGGGSLEAQGPGMHSSRENPIRGVSRARARVHGSTLEIEADLGGVARLGWLLLILPITLGLILAGVTWMQLSGAERAGDYLGPVLMTGIWIVLAPLFLWHIRTRTVKAVEALLYSAANATRSA